MNFQLVISLILIIAIILIDSTLGQIIDGMDAQENQFKYQVIIYTGKYKCGGAIIDEIHILTAAHCVDNFNIADITVFAGMNEADDFMRTVRLVKKVHIHPNYSFHGSEYADDFGIYTLPQPQNDIAILQLSRVIQLGGEIDKIHLPTTTIPYYHTSIIANWGQTDLSGCFPDELQWTIMIIDDPDTCRSKGALHRANEFCAYTSDQISMLAPGDSGSALCSYGKIVGVASYGWRSSEAPAIFTNVYDHLDFINRAISDSSM